ncbi:MAG: hypothetical protein ACFCVK_21790 [Acidimicrobiales bacterium]
MPGLAEAMIRTRHGAVAADLCRLVDGRRPPYHSASAFRFTYDRTAGRDVADVSASTVAT